MPIPKTGTSLSNIQHSRRRFLSATGLALGGAAVAAGLVPRWPRTNSFAAEEPPTGSRKIGYALVGLGNLSTNQLAPAFAKTKHSRLVGIVTGTPSKEAIWAEKYRIAQRNIYNYETFDRVADNPDIDVIYVVLPNSMHAEYTIRAAKAGKHVLCEKPMAVSSAECRSMIDACKTARRKLAIGYRCQFEPHHQECMRLARTERFGSLKMIDAGFGFRIGDPTQWRLKKKMAGGGALMDVGIYALQACRYLTGEEPRTITALETKTDHEKFAEVDETLTWSMTFPNGVIANCTTTYNFSGFNRFRAFAERGNFGLEPAFSYQGITGTTSQGPIEIPPIDQFAAEIDDFSRCVLDDLPTRVPGEEGLRDLLAIEAIYQSIQRGSAVNLS